MFRGAVRGAAELVDPGHAVDILIGVGDVQEIVLLVVFLLRRNKTIKVLGHGEIEAKYVSYLVQGAHGCRCWWNDVVHKEE